MISMDGGIDAVLLLHVSLERASCLRAVAHNPVLVGSWVMKKLLMGGPSLFSKGGQTMIVSRGDQAVISCLCRSTGKQEASFSCVVEFEKIRCTQFQEGSLRARNSLFRASVMERCIVQWKVAQRVMESYPACNGKFRSEQWKVDHYSSGNTPSCSGNTNVIASESCPLQQLTKR